MTVRLSTARARSVRNSASSICSALWGGGGRGGGRGGAVKQKGQGRDRALNSRAQTALLHHSLVVPKTCPYPALSHCHSIVVSTCLQPALSHCHSLVQPVQSAQLCLQCPDHAPRRGGRAAPAEHAPHHAAQRARAAPCPTAVAASRPAPAAPPLRLGLGLQDTLALLVAQALGLCREAIGQKQSLGWAIFPTP